MDVLNKDTAGLDAMAAEIRRLKRELEAYKRLEKLLEDGADADQDPDGSWNMNEAMSILSDWRFREWVKTGVQR